MAMRPNIHSNRKVQYKKFIELGLIVSLFLHILLLQGYKRIQIRPIKINKALPQMDVVDVPVVKHTKTSQPPRRPSVPIPSEDEEILDVDMDDPFIDVWDPDYTPPPPPEPTEDQWTIPFVAFDKRPTPVGGYEAILSKVVYPDIAKKAGIEGEVIVAVQIDEKGNVISTRVMKSLGPNGCDDAAMRAVRAVRWNPAYQRDMPVKVWVTIPVEFKLVRR
jgi:protein TonB